MQRKRTKQFCVKSLIDTSFIDGIFAKKKINYFCKFQLFVCTCSIILRHCSFLYCLVCYQNIRWFSRQRSRDLKLFNNSNKQIETSLTTKNRLKLYKKSQTTVNVVYNWQWLFEPIFKHWHCTKNIRYQIKAYKNYEKLNIIATREFEKYYATIYPFIQVIIMISSYRNILNQPLMASTTVNIFSYHQTVFFSNRYN